MNRPLRGRTYQHQQTQLIAGSANSDAADGRSHAELRRPLPRRVAIAEIGINLDGEVVSACIIRGLRSDFDKAVQVAALQGRWKMLERRGENPDSSPPSVLHSGSS